MPTYDVISTGKLIGEVEALAVRWCPYRDEVLVEVDQERVPLLDYVRDEQRELPGGQDAQRARGDEQDPPQAGLRYSYRVYPSRPHEGRR